MLLTVKSIRIKRMNVEIFCERGVCRGKGVRWEEGAFAGSKRRSQGRVALSLGRSQGARNACMIVFAADVRFFCKFEFYVHIHYYF